MAVDSGEDSAKIAELTAVVEAVRARVRARYPEPNGAANGSWQGGGIAVPIADLMPLVHARDAAQAKIAAIGSVNPRAGGLANRAIQAVKKTIARALQWFIRDQITFNRETVSALEAVIEALNEHNRALVSLAAQANERDQALAAQIERLEPELRELKDIRSHWPELRANLGEQSYRERNPVSAKRGRSAGRLSTSVHFDGDQFPRDRQSPACRLSRRAGSDHCRYSQKPLGRFPEGSGRIWADDS